jgi:hypothetical protein
VNKGLRYLHTITVNVLESFGTKCEIVNSISKKKILNTMLHNYLSIFKICALLRHSRFRSLYKFLCPTFNVSFRPHCGPGVDSGFDRYEYQEYFLGVKAAGA